MEAGYEPRHVTDCPSSSRLLVAMGALHCVGLGGGGVGVTFRGPLTWPGTAAPPPMLTQPLPIPHLIGHSPYCMQIPRSVFQEGSGLYSSTRRH